MHGVFLGKVGETSNQSVCETVLDSARQYETRQNKISTIDNFCPLIVDQMSVWMDGRV